MAGFILKPAICYFLTQYKTIGAIPADSHSSNEAICAGSDRELDRLYTFRNPELYCTHTVWIPRRRLPFWFQKVNRQISAFWAWASNCFLSKTVFTVYPKCRNRTFAFLGDVPNNPNIVDAFKSPQTITSKKQWALPSRRSAL